MLIRCRFSIVRTSGIPAKRQFRTVTPSGEVVRDGLPTKRGLYDPSLEKGEQRPPHNLSLKLMV